MTPMAQLLALALIGLVAQLVDGTLGMAYGATSASLLLLWGLGPVAVSASVHLAETITTAASALSHWRLGNADRRLVRNLIVPGAIGAFVGATVLSRAPSALVKPVVAMILMGIGLRILWRFWNHAAPVRRNPPSGRWLIPLGLLAGFLDAVGGGGWGSITTTTLMAQGGIEPRRVVGSVDTSEFPVTLAAVLGFALSGRLGDIHWLWVAGLVIGGAVAAPLAAWLIRVFPSQMLGILVGAMILLTNLRILLLALRVPFEIRWSAYLVLGGTLAILALLAWRRQRALASIPYAEGAAE